ncbi:hypothetical protein [Microbacterium sp. Mcb102]|uniref:hypothetical protein n=1 Tax=Microbacterium sp. Mcb102 TaxID=2926012 RepID=UPI0021CA0FFB|nr:hypothetical protein [Microbacterium sp. Mcb102]
MTDLSALIPPHEPSEDTFATVGGMALDAIPLLGPLAGRALDHALAARERARRHEFDTAIVGEVQRLAERTEAALTVADIVSSEEFLATLARTRREAAETASTSKRQRLARAAVASLDSDALTRAEREDYLRLITELDDLHVWLLAFFADPRAWLIAHELMHTFASVSGGSPSGPLEVALDRFGVTFSATVEAALADLERLGLADVPPRTLRTFMTASGMFESRITRRGRAFLRYLDEGDPAEAEPPSV